MRTQFTLKHLSIFSQLLTPLTAKEKFNWQSKGTCGVPYTQPNADIFETIEERHTRAEDFWKRVGRTLNLNQHEQDKKIKKASTRIIGGQTAKEHSWPWQVYLVTHGLFDGYYDKFIECGGVLIDPWWVVTAAHCIGDNSPNVPQNQKPSGEATVGLHEIDIYGSSSERDPGTKIPIDTFIRHPQWDTKTFENDIALLKLSRPAFSWDGSSHQIDSQNIAPICLPDSETCFARETPCVVTGWGITSLNYDRNPELQEVAVRIMANDECKMHDTYAKYVKENMVCAGFRNGKKDACAGDSGGPLMCRVIDPNTGVYTNNWQLFGIVSWGISCAKPNQPGVYTRVAKYADWVYNVTNNKGDEELNDVQCTKYEQDVESKWKEDVLHVFPTVKPAPPQEVVTGGRCDITAVSDLSIRGIQTIKSHNDFQGTSKSVMASYEKYQECILDLQNPNPDHKICVTIDDLKVDCAGRSAGKADVADAGDYVSLTSTSDPSQNLDEICAVRSRNPIVVCDPTQIVMEFFTDAYQQKNRKTGEISQKQVFDQGWSAKIEVKYANHDCNPDPNPATLQDGEAIRLLSENVVEDDKRAGRFLMNQYGYNSRCQWSVSAAENTELYFEVEYLRTARRVRRGACDSVKDDVLFITDTNGQGCGRTLFNGNTGDINAKGSIIHNFCGGYKRKRGTPRYIKAGSNTVCVAFFAKAHLEGDRKRGRGFRVNVVASSLDPNESL